MKMLNKSLLAIGALALSTFSHSAVVTWSADVSAVWLPGSIAPIGPNPANPAISGGGKVLSWGVPANTGDLQSSLTITDPAAGAILSTYNCGTNPCTPPAASPFKADSITVTHANNVINAPSLTDAWLQLTVDLTPVTPIPDVAQVLPSVTYKVKFFETPNSGTCVIGSVSVCDDIFVLTEGLLNTQFDYDSVTYYVNAFPTAESVGLNVLDPTACTKAGLAAGCVGFLTQESKKNVLQFGFTVSDTKLVPPTTVPEPGSLALMGLALAGMGAVSRRRSAKQTKA